MVLFIKVDLWHFWIKNILFNCLDLQKKMFTSLLIPDKFGVFFVINNWYSACFTLTTLKHWKCWIKCYDVEYPLNFLWEINSIVDTMGFHSRAIPLKLIAQNRSRLNFIHELHPEQILYKKIFWIRLADIFQKDLLDMFDISRFASTYVRCSQKLTKPCSIRFKAIGPKIKKVLVFFKHIWFFVTLPVFGLWPHFEPL